MYPHQKLLSDNSIAETSLPADIQEAIQKFTSIFSDYKEALQDQELAEARELGEQLTALSGEIADEIKEHLDDETEEELSPEEQRAKVLARLVKEGKTKLTVGDLAAAEYPGANSLGRKFKHLVGSYRLEKKLGDGYCHISEL